MSIERPCFGDEIKMENIRYIASDITPDQFLARMRKHIRTYSKNKKGRLELHDWQYLNY